MRTKKKPKAPKVVKPIQKKAKPPEPVATVVEPADYVLGAMVERVNPDGSVQVVTPKLAPETFQADGVSLSRCVSDKQRADGIRGTLDMTDSKGKTLTVELTERGLLTVLMTCGR